jgi:membrane fusion protein (multidrug efflux system)
VRAQLVKAEETALDYAITAPWDGVVSRLIVKDGEFVAPRAPLLEMYDPSSLVIRAAVPEKHAVEIAAGVRVDVTLDAFPGEVLPGRVARVYPYLDPRLRSRVMEIVLERPIDLLPGMFARLKVLLEIVDDAVVVPAESVVSTPKGPVVFVVESDTALVRMVKIGIEDGGRIQIVEGIHPGDRVVVAGNERLKDGATVRIAGDAGSGVGPSQGAAQGAAGTPSGGKTDGGVGRQ